jgi:hypothetical protein
MNQEQIFGLIRHGLTTLGGIAIAKGWINEEETYELIGILMSIVGFAWSYGAKMKAQKEA